MRCTATRVLALLALVAACGEGSESGRSTVTVFAAASLTESFTQLAAGFEAEHDVDVVLNFAASSELVAQILEGAPADVFASADEANMQKLLDQGAVREPPVAFARNELTIAVEHGNPRAITGLADLADRDIRVALCAEEVPCGTYAGHALDAAGVSVAPLTRGESVKATLALVELGEADAAIVYVTDVDASDAVDAVAIAPDENIVATLPIAVLDDSDASSAFIEFVASERGRGVLATFGFRAP